MFRDKKHISLSYIYFVVAVLGNGAIGVAAYVYNQDFYWVLIISVPFLFYLTFNLRREGKRVLPEGVVRNSPVFSDKSKLTVVIGNNQCIEKKLASIFTIGILEKYQRDLYQKHQKDAGNEKKKSEELITTLNLTGGDRIWRIEPDYKGCRSNTGQFSAEMFKTNVCRHDIKAIEITLSLLTVNVNDIDLYNQAKTKLRATGINGVNSYFGYSGFYNADGMIHFIDSLRQFSGGKPVGFKIRIDDSKEFLKICHAIRMTQIAPDFVVVEGFDKPSNSTDLNITDSYGMPLYEALQFVSTTLQNYGLDKQILIIAKANITSGLDMLKVLALGAHAVRTVMPGYRMISSYDNKISEIGSIARYSSLLQLAAFHNEIIEDAVRAMKYLGFKSIKELSPASFFRRLFVLDENAFKSSKDYLVVSNPSQILVKMNSPIASEKTNDLLVK